MAVSKGVRKAARLQGEYPGDSGCVESGVEWCFNEEDWRQVDGRMPREHWEAVAPTSSSQTLGACLAGRLGGDGHIHKLQHLGATALADLDGLHGCG